MTSTQGKGLPTAAVGCGPIPTGVMMEGEQVSVAP
jgi:hypothetical protein